MNTLPDKAHDEAGLAAIGAHFSDTMLFVSLNDGREIGVPLSLPWLQWLAHARPEQRENWRLEPGGWAIYWDELDDGLEVEHLLSHQPLT